MKPISETLPTILERIGPPATGETKPMPTGPEHGKAGSGGKVPAPAMSETEVTVMRDLLDKGSLSPAEVDSAMDRLLPPSVATSFRAKINWGSDPNYIGATEDYELHGEPSRKDTLDSIEMLDRWMRPAGHNEVVIELGKLRALVTTRKEDADSLSVIIGAFAEQIEQNRYPIDVVRQARKDSADLCKFWPAWADFKERCDELFLKRKAFYNALRRYLATSKSGLQG